MVALVGLIIVAIAVGHLYTPVIGWLTLGIGLIVGALLDWVAGLFNKSKDE